MENGEEREDSLADIDPLLKQEPKLYPLVPALELSRRISSDDSDTKPTVATSSQTGTQVSSSKKSSSRRGEEEKLPTNVIVDATSAIDDYGNDDRRAGKVRVKYIENTRARGATFNKRRNGILKKAYELSQLTGTVVCVVVFNEARSKMYEYCSAEPRAVFEKIATYYGYAERRRNDTLRAPLKGYVNISVNEPELAAAAREAAAVAAVRHEPKRIHEVLQKRNKHFNVKIPPITTGALAASSSETTSEKKTTETQTEATLHELFRYESRNGVLPSLSLDDENALEVPSTSGMGVINDDFENALRDVGINGESRKERFDEVGTCNDDVKYKDKKSSFKDEDRGVGEYGRFGVCKDEINEGLPIIENRAGDADSSDGRNKYNETSCEKVRAVGNI